MPDHVTAPIPALLQLIVVRFPHVAEQVRGEAARRIRALRLDLDDDAGQLQLPLLDFRHVLQRETAADAHGRERVGRDLVGRLDELFVGDPEQGRHPTERRVAALDIAVELARNERQRERGSIVDERRAVAVEQDAARRRDRTHSRAVLVGGVEEPAAFEHLQIPELADDDQEGHHHGRRDRDHALLTRVAAVARRQSSGVHGQELRSRNDSAVSSANTKAAPRNPL